MSNKNPNVRPLEAAAVESPPDALRTAYEIHTLAQMVYSRLAPQAYAPAVVPGLYH